MLFIEHDACTYINVDYCSRAGLTLSCVQSYFVNKVVPTCKTTYDSLELSHASTRLSAQRDINQVSMSPKHKRTDEPIASACGRVYQILSRLFFSNSIFVSNVRIFINVTNDKEIMDKNTTISFNQRSKAIKFA